MLMVMMVLMMMTYCVEWHDEGRYKWQMEQGRNDVWTLPLQPMPLQLPSLQEG